MTLLTVLFTMDCESVATPQVQRGPRTWQGSARSIEAYCDRLLAAGHAPTLFLDPLTAEEHAPLLEELAGRGIEMGSYVHPPGLTDGRYGRSLGEYDAERQRGLFEHCRDRSREVFGTAPRSLRTGDYSASDETYRVAYEAGYRQGSLSSPGRNLPKQAAVWVDAPRDAHYPAPDARLRSGRLPFLELPVTSDPDRDFRKGVPYEFVIEAGKFEGWHQLLAEAQLERMARERAPFPALCITTRSTVPYGRREIEQSRTLDRLIEYVEELGERYAVRALTLADAHERYRAELVARV